MAPVFYDLRNDMFIVVHQTLSAGGQLKFRRWLPPVLFENWMNILELVNAYDFDNIEDVVTWKWCKLESSLLNPCIIS